MIQARGLFKSYGSFQVLKGLDLNVQKGKIYGLLGRNGAGKSTVMHVLTGLTRADGGSCLVNGWDVDKVGHPADLHIGYMPEHPGFYPWMSGEETLLYLGSRFECRLLAQRASELLHWTGLSHASARRVEGYSRDMLQRLGLAAALINDPELILLDEPSSALDPEARGDVLRLILRLKAQGKTVFFSTHDLGDAEMVCDHIGILSYGKTVMEKALSDLRMQHNMDSLKNIIKGGENIEN